MEIPKTETIEEYYLRNGQVFDIVKARKDWKKNDQDSEDCFYRQMGYYAQ